MSTGAGFATPYRSPRTFLRWLLETEANAGSKQVLLFPGVPIGLGQIDPGADPARRVPFPFETERQHLARHDIYAHAITAGQLQNITCVIGLLGQRSSISGQVVHA